MNIRYVGEGKVYLIAGGGKCYSDIAAKFCRSEKSVEEIIGSESTLNALKAIVESGHQAALEFDDFIFGIEGYSRVTEVQLVRKRHASYNIKSGRVDKHGKRSFDVVLPKTLAEPNPKLITRVMVDPADIFITKNEAQGQRWTGTQWVAEKDVETIIPLSELLREVSVDGVSYDTSFAGLDIDDKFILDAIEDWYNNGVDEGYPEEDLRYLKPQATEFKACIKMNLSGLLDWFKVRMCNRAQEEIRDLATKIYKICVKEFPIVFQDAGASCKCIGYCPEKEQCEKLKGKIPTKAEAMVAIREWQKIKNGEVLTGFDWSVYDEKGNFKGFT